MATVRGYPQLVWSQVSPVMLPVNTEQCAGFSLSSDKATGDQAPQHCASPGCPGLPLILLCSPVSAGLKNKKSQPCDRDSSDNVCVTGHLGLATNSGAEKMPDCIRPTKTNNSFILRIPLGGAKRNLTFNSTNSFVSSLLISFVHHRFQIGKRVISRLADIFCASSPAMTVEPY